MCKYANRQTFLVCAVVLPHSDHSCPSDNLRSFSLGVAVVENDMQTCEQEKILFTWRKKNEGMENDLVHNLVSKNILH